MKISTFIGINYIIQGLISILFGGIMNVYLTDIGWISAELSVFYIITIPVLLKPIINQISEKIHIVLAPILSILGFLGIIFVGMIPFILSIFLILLSTLGQAVFDVKADKSMLSSKNISHFPRLQAVWKAAGASFGSIFAGFRNYFEIQGFIAIYVSIIIIWMILPSIFPVGDKKPLNLPKNSQSGEDFNKIIDLSDFPERRVSLISKDEQIVLLLGILFIFFLNVTNLTSYSLEVYLDSISTENLDEFFLYSGIGQILSIVFMVVFPKLFTTDKRRPQISIFLIFFSVSAMISPFILFYGPWYLYLIIYTLNSTIILFFSYRISQIYIYMIPNSRRGFYYQIISVAYLISKIIFEQFGIYSYNWIGFENQIWFLVGINLLFTIPIYFILIVRIRKNYICCSEQNSSDISQSPSISGKISHEYPLFSI